ncbi:MULTISPECIES: DUF4258 domain-containing protein [unclassified Acinetobacter]|uniref:DUF4258 domain-containing protein n=1 Tax=unclassified Acinetobacter TaxID=196816 RepID=UPI0025C71400|nr:MULTISPECIES: DUF4258 domain-containing protein [unclassified Acinetobacter]
MHSFNTTRHSNKRMKQRGITKDMIDFTILFGEIDGDKYFTNQKNIKDEISMIDLKIMQLRKLRKTALKVLDKGGVTVVADNGNIISTYNFNSYLSY